jgi:two-component system sensor histidine kinase CiaH
MFSKVKKRLTLLNSMVMGAFLLGFAIVSFASLIWAVYREEKRDLLSYAKEETHENLRILIDKEYLRPDFPKNELPEEAVLFFYLFDNQQNLIHYSEPHPEIRSLVREKFKHWTVEPGKPALTFFRRPGQDFVIMLVSLPIIKDHTVLGTIYVGKDETVYYQVLKRLLSILGGFLVIFLALVSLLGYLLAGRAMEPIKRSHEKQRQFLADASHELRTPLSVLLSSVDAVQRDCAPQMTDFARQVLADMKDEIKKMSRIVGDLLTLARSDDSALQVMKERFNLRLVAEPIIRTLQPLAQEKAIDLAMEVPEEALLYADKERIAQLLVILLDNALKYTPDHGKVRLSIPPPQSDPPELKIIVSDTGIGIAPEEQRLIFERFYRVDKARSRQIGGSGLGLAIAQWIVESHGGSIKVISQPGQGTSFIVTLPQPNGLYQSLPH